MRRREFLSLVGGAAAPYAFWPLAARAQQPAMPVIGYLSAASPGSISHWVAVFHQGLAETGYIERRNVAIEYRSAEGQYDRLPAMAAELVRLQVAVIVAIPIPAALAAKAATSTIPIVFSVGTDPVTLGLVTSLGRPGGNATGVYFFLTELGAKALELMRDLLPAAKRIGALVNPNNPGNEAWAREATTTASTLDLKIDLVQASDIRTIDTAFVGFLSAKAEALVVAPDAQHP